jgi:isopentenyl-diphosphate Delta-isomerase
MMDTRQPDTTSGTQVILVDEQDNELGAMDKLLAHQPPVLHRAFSIFIFNRKNEMLLQQRAAGKYHSPGLWTNACCSHPMPGELTEAAAKRRLKEELGFETGIEKIFHFSYKAAFDNGLGEHEFDHVFAGYYEGDINPNPDEVGDYCYLSMKEISKRMAEQPGTFTVWFQLAFPRICQWMDEQVQINDGN